MRIESIKLENFRNYETLELALHPGTNIFYGDNAQGKTNILESIYLCGTTKSHRASRDREMIRFDCDESHIRMILSKNDVPYRIDMHLRKNKAKGIAINGVPIRKAGELVGLGSFIFFSPEDLNIIKNGPSERRRFIDMELCQMSAEYVHDLANYNRALMSRNKVLKEINFRPEYRDTLDVWDAQLVRYGSTIIRMRREFVSSLADLVREVHGKLTGGREELLLGYECNKGEEELARALADGREKDIQMKMTHAGPHRDDLLFKIGDVDVRKYGSQGQQRTTALSLKLAEIELVRKTSRQTPVLLLDDVLSELDRNRQHFLLESIDQVQTLITCTGVEDFLENNFRIDRLFNVKQGAVQEDINGTKL